MGALEHSRQRNLILKLSKGYLMDREALPPFQMYFSCKLHKQGQGEQGAPWEPPSFPLEKMPLE